MKLSKTLLDLFFPPKCVFCEKLLTKQDDLFCCRACEASVKYYSGPLPGTGFTEGTAPLSYRDSVREAVHRFKFNGRDYYAKAFARYTAEAIQRDIPAFDVLSWMPVSRRRRRSRGYDQAELLCRETAAILGLPYQRFLEKVKDNTPQSGLKREERQENVRGAYRAVNTEQLAGRRVLLMDDIITTGATLSEGSHILLKAGAQEVFAAAFACAEREIVQETGEASTDEPKNSDYTNDGH